MSIDQGIAFEDAALDSSLEEQTLAMNMESSEKEPSEPTFRDFNLIQEVVDAVEASGYTHPTAIQAQIIPYMLQGRDVLAQSQTGTGKTAAFALPILSRLDLEERTPQVLVLAPTRELAIQVSKSFENYASNLDDFRVAAIYGGQDYEIQFRALRQGVQVVVGTPGRVIDHVKRGTLNLSAINCLVLDEADEMLNMGFLEDVQFILQQAPESRQIALFSATMPAAIQEIASEYLNDPAEIKIKRKTMTAESIRQRAIFVSPREKLDVLTRVLEVEETDGVIVFTKTRESTLQVADQLCQSGLKAVALNGDMPQRVRERTIDQLKSGHLDILVATDVAARGLDVPRVSHVINFDLPHDSESYVHRIGRTGRAGRKGEAIIFLTNAQRRKLRLIEQTTKQSIEEMSVPSVKSINAKRIERFKQNITAAMENPEVAMFEKMINEYAEESGQSLTRVAAVLASLAQNGREFFLTERRKPKAEFEGEQRDRRSRDDSDDRQDRSRRSLRERKSGPEEGMLRYRIEVGHRDGVRPGNIVGAVANEAGLDSAYIGHISIFNDFSTIDLPEGMPREIFQILKKTWVAGKQLQISLDNKRPSRSKGKGRKQEERE